MSIKVDDAVAERFSVTSASDALARTAPLYGRVKAVIPPIEWPFFAGDIDAILALKRERNAVILAHNYQTPEIFHCVADIVGDSLALAREATRVDADVIVLAGVHFMAETAKLLNPDKTVLIPDAAAGCSLASSITPADVRLLAPALSRRSGRDLRQYVGSSEGGVGCLLHLRQREEDRRVAQAPIGSSCFPTNISRRMSPRKPASRSSRGLGIARSMSASPRRKYGCCASNIRVWSCSPIRSAHRKSLPKRISPDRLPRMIQYVDVEKPSRVVLVTECSMSDNVAVEHPDIEFVRPCNLCPHMKRITLPKIRRALETMSHEVTINPTVAAGARRAVERMLEV